jgi:hypothetical protein
MFYRNELFWTSQSSDILPLDSVVGRCLVLEPTIWMMGRPKTPRYLEDDIYVCEYQMDRNQRSFEKIQPKNRYCINTEPYMFNYYSKKLCIKSRYFLPYISFFLIKWLVVYNHLTFWGTVIWLVIRPICCGTATVKLGNSKKYDEEVKMPRTEERNGSRTKCWKLDEKEECQELQKMTKERHQDLTKWFIRFSITFNYIDQCSFPLFLVHISLSSFPHSPLDCYLLSLGDPDFHSHHTHTHTRNQ